ncbi:hypothetical protein TNIN_398201 [Trichonephila inaurata madagascariensis]|uniref:Uncharacterized protein n=1 Tax=Trichonephila inaurata madagascariensis TaxID=2747483 RepID=A0A8X6WMV5_9ARAC|nr:hypothetical protein TNIN_398201 [Trichonephila inaurata madagascariensis]
MDETPYTKLLKMIKIDAIDFYKDSARDFKWGDLTNDTVLHISCGLRDLSEKFLKIFPYVRQIIDVDFMNSDDGCVHETASDTSDAFHEGVIIKGENLTEWINVNKMFCVHCFDLFSDKKDIFQKLYDVMVEGGETAILFLLDSSYFSFLEEFSSIHFWAKFLEVNKSFYSVRILTYLHATYCHIRWNITRKR